MKLAAAVLVLALQQAPLSEVIEVRRHNVDVVVTDRAGNPVRGLHGSDFELLEDGVAQEITNFSAYDDRIDASSAPSSNAAMPAPTRRLVFFIDDMSMHPRNRQKLVEEATKLLEKAMRPGDEGAVVRPGEAAESVALTFTSDREELRSALGKAVAENTWRVNVAFAAEHERFQVDAAFCGGPQERRQVARRHADRVLRRVRHRLATLRAIVSTMAPLDGRKVLIVATESLPAEPGREFFDVRLSELKIGSASVDEPPTSIGDHGTTDFVDMTSAIEDVARTAASHGITIYALRPELDLRMTEEIPMRAVHRAMANSDKTVNLLTRTTGGAWSMGAAQMDEVLDTVASDVDSYYSLAYRAQSASFDKSHRVEVRVRNHPEYAVRARAEVMRKSPKREMNDRVVEALFTESMPNELGVTIEASDPQPIKGERGRYRVTVDVGVPLGALTYLPAGDSQHGTFTVHYAVASKDLDFVNGTEPVQVVDIPLADFDAARTKAWTHTVNLVVERGMHRIVVGVLDGTSQVAGLSGMTIDVP